ncbi:MAG: MFS transporter [Chitinophagaceae bacterium]|nr:MAG: MFS transporter [Chitinophagaceae bacterium]
MTKQERIILFLLASLNFTHFLDFMIIMPLSNYLIPYFRIDAREFSFLVSSYSISAAVSGFCTAFIVDNLDRKKVLVISYIGFMIGTIACGFTNSFTLLLVARVVAGLFGGIIGAQVMAIIADTFSYERRGKAMSSVTASFAVASIVGVPFSLKLTELFGGDWHTPFLLVGGVGILMIPFVIRYVPPIAGHLQRSTRKSPLDLLRTILHNPARRSALLFSCLLMMGHFLIIPFITPFLEFNKGYHKSLIPIIYLAGGGASLLGAVFLGRLADQRGKLPVFSVCVFLSLFMVLMITSMPVVPFGVVLLFFALWFIFSTGRALTAQAMISEVVPPEERGSFMSFNGCVQQAGTGIASLIAGYVVYNDNSGKLYHYEWLGYLSIIVLVVSLLMARKLFASTDARSVPA